MYMKEFIFFVRWWEFVFSLQIIIIIIIYSEN